MVGRPRSEEARNAILNAALLLCARDGYRNVTLKGIAEAAGTGRQTLYRWWQTKAEVLLEAMTDVIGPTLPHLVPSGDPHADLVAFLRQTFALTEGVSGQVVVGLMADAQNDAEFSAKLRDQLVNPRRQALREVLAEGLLPPDVDLELAVDMIFGVMWYRLLNRHADVSQGLAEELAGLVARIT